VPPRRRRRHGYQEHHHLDPVLEAALDSEAARLAAIEDPALAVQAVTEFFNGLERALEAVAESRHRAVIELYEDLGSYQMVADATGLSKTRVGVLVREARRAGL
jgi:DNA-directed RNA polymerase specialized sigma24 family protein